MLFIVDQSMTTEVAIIIALGTVLIVLLFASTIGLMYFCYQKRSPTYVDDKDEKRPPSIATKDISNKIPISTIFSGDVLIARSEFETLTEQERLRSNLASIQGGLNVNKRFSTNPDILPFDENRVKLRSKANRNDYINASWIYQPSKQKEYDSLMMHPFLPIDNIGMIVCDAPNEVSSNRYGEMIYQHDVDLILHISRTDSHKTGSVLALLREVPGEPSDVSRKLLKSSFIEKYLVKEEWDISTERGKTNQLTFVELKGFSLYKEEAIHQVLRTITFIRNKFGCDREYATMVIHDEQSGVSEAAIFAALFNLLEQLDDALLNTDGHGDKNQSIDVFRVLNDLRKKRMSMIHTFEDFSFIHQVLMYYVKHKSTYDEMLGSNLPEKECPSIGTADTKSLCSAETDNASSMVVSTNSPSSNEYRPISYLIDEIRQAEASDGTYLVYQDKGNERADKNNSSSSYEDIPVTYLIDEINQSKKNDANGRKPN